MLPLSRASTGASCGHLYGADDRKLIQQRLQADAAAAAAHDVRDPHLHVLRRSLHAN